MITRRGEYRAPVRLAVAAPIMRGTVPGRFDVLVVAGCVKEFEYRRPIGIMLLLRAAQDIRASHDKGEEI